MRAACFSWNPSWLLLPSYAYSTTTGKSCSPRPCLESFSEHSCPVIPSATDLRNTVQKGIGAGPACVQLLPCNSTAPWCTSTLLAPSMLPTPCPIPKCQALQADGTDGDCLQAAHACGVTHVVMGCSAALVKLLAKATLDLASVLHATKGEGRKRLGPWQAALAPNLSQLPHSAMLHWALLPAGSVPWAAPAGEWLSLLYRQVNWGTEGLWACSGVMQGANHGRGMSAFQHSSSETCCSVLVLQDWHYVKHSECTSGGLSSSPLSHLQQHQKYAAVAWRQFRPDPALFTAAGGFRHLL